MNTLTIYFLKRFFLYFLSFTLLASVLISGGYLHQLVLTALEKNIPFVSILKLFAFTQVAQFGLVAPIAYLIASLLTLTDFKSKSELVALAAAGISNLKIFYPVFKVGMILLFILLFWYHFVMPNARWEFRKLRDKIEEYNPIDLAAEPATFIRIHHHSDKERHFYFDSKVRYGQNFDAVEYKSVHLREYGLNEKGLTLKRFVFAETARRLLVNHSNGKSFFVLRLFKGFFILPRVQGSITQSYSFQNGFLDLRLSSFETVKTIDEQKPKDSQLYSELLLTLRSWQDQLPKPEREIRDFESELHLRFAAPALVPCLILLIFILVFHSTIQTRSFALIASLTLVILYYSAFVISKMVAVETPGRMFIMWLPNFLLLMAAGSLYLFRRSP